MLVDNPLTLFNPEQTTDISEFFHTELFPSFTSSAASSSSRASSPSSASFVLTTPPNPTLSTPPEIASTDSYNGLFNFLEDDIKALNDPLFSLSTISSSAFDFGGGGGGGGSFNFDAPPSMPLAIDPQLVGTPSSTAESPEEEKESTKLTLTINPVKVGGYGKGRKGTVQSGGVTKKTPAPTLSSTPPASSLLFSAVPPPKDNKENKEGEDGRDDDDDIPADWRPSPEVLAKMTSKEKRQLRNKISARNFRVRRKEYITTLEMDIAERDRLLNAIRTELGSTQSENVALRQEIAALKKALLDGRGGALTSEDIPVLNLPPPAPLPPISAASSVSSSGLVTPNVHKDVPNVATSPRLNAFWGGNVGLNMGGGGIASVHTVLVPELSALARNVNRPPNSTGSNGSPLQENLNPALNLNPNLNHNSSAPVTNALSKAGLGGFDGFLDMNPFTMKSLDAYRMQLWTRMAQSQAQQSQSYPSPQSSPGSTSSTLSHQPQSPPPLISSPSPFTQQPLPSSPPLQGLAGGIRPHWFVSSPKLASASTSVLSGKHTTGLPTPPTSPNLGSSKKPSANEKEQAYIAALASQTLFKKLGGAFWDAFSGSSSSPSPSSSSAQASLARNFDSEKVRKVLEGKAVVRVVDLEPSTPPATPKISSASCSSETKIKKDDCDCSRILEEGMRSLTLGRK